MTFEISEKEWRDSAKKLDHIKMYGPDLLGENYNWEKYQKIVIASLKESKTVEIFAKPFKPQYKFKKEEHNTIDDITKEFQPQTKPIIKKLQKLADKTKKQEDIPSLKLKLNKDQIEPFIEVFGQINQQNARFISKIESRSNGFYYKTLPITINAGNTYYVDDTSADKIDRINEDLSEDCPKIVEREF